MTAAAILLAILVVAGILLYLHHRLTGGDNTIVEPDPQAMRSHHHATVAGGDDGCCGMHITCEKDSLVAGIDSELLYYDDEELDVYKGRQAQDYTENEIEIFRDILITLKPDDIAGWARSLTTRGITMPPSIKEELLMIVAEARNHKAIISL